MGHQDQGEQRQKNVYLAGKHNAEFMIMIMIRLF